jgi:hypothetical protein
MDKLEFKQTYKDFLNGNYNGTPLDLSINKWELISENKLIDEGLDNCTLCEMHNNNSCYTCPVYQYTQMSYCKSTPFQEFREHVDECLTCHEDDDIGIADYCIVARDIAKKELKFLRFVKELTEKKVINGVWED